MPIRRPDHGCHGYSSSRNSVPWAFSSLVVQFDQAACLTRLQATSTRGVRDHIRRVAGCATSTGFAGHAGATANLNLTFHPDRSVGANHSNGAFHGIFPFGPLGSGPSSRARGDTHGMTRKDYSDDFSESVSIGRMRRRLPVAAKIALVTAALTMAVGASPMPPGASAFLIRCVSTIGTSSIRIGR